MDQAAVLYRHNQQPRKGLALAGLIFFVKAVLLIPHLIIVGVLGNLAMAVGYVGFWIVGFTGQLPPALQGLISMWVRWLSRSYGWLAGITDDYPPFETDPAGYPFDARTPVNENPSKGWAVAGILLFPKALALIPHMILLWFVMVAAVIATWFGYLAVVFTGRLPLGIQDFVAGTVQWYVRVMSWFLGLVDEYPPFGVKIQPAG